jgi:hypothetical protein
VTAALPPTKMPLPPAEIVPELLMPPELLVLPEKVAIVTDATCLLPLPVMAVAADEDAVVARRDCAGIADAAGEG